MYYEYYQVKGDWMNGIYGIWEAEKRIERMEPVGKKPCRKKYL